MGLLDRKVYNTLATAPNRLPSSVGSDRFAFASLQIDNFSGKFIQVDDTQFVPPFTQGWVTTLAPTPKTSIKVAVAVPSLAAQTGNDGAVIVTLYEDPIGASGGTASQSFVNIPEVVNLSFVLNTGIAGVVNNYNLAQLGIVGGNFYIHSVALSYEPTGAAFANTISAEVNFGTQRGDGVALLAVTPGAPYCQMDMDELFVNSATVVATGTSTAGAPAGRVTITFSQA